MSKKPRTPAPERPVARVLPLVPVSTVDRGFDYQVDESMHEDAQPGVMVRIMFGGRRIDGVILERCTDTDFEGRLSWIERVISPIQVLPPRSRQLVEAIAARYAGTRSDVIRLAIPPRHAGAEAADTTTSWDELGAVEEPDLAEWLTYQYGDSFVDAVLSGAPARAVWQLAPNDDGQAAIAALAVKIATTGHSSLIVLPDQRDVDRMVATLRTMVSAKQVCDFTASLGPQARYRRFLSILQGQARIVVGTRAAMWAPLHKLRLCVIFDDGDDNLVDKHAPYPHAREVLTTRSAHSGCALVIAGHSRTAEAQLLVDKGWAHSLQAPREVIHARMPRIRAVGDTDFELARDPLARSARLPRIAFEAMRQGLQAGAPVLIQVPRRGYIPSLRCGDCGHPARCRHCHGPIAQSTGAHGPTGALECRWCGRPAAHHRCGECGSTKLKASVKGAIRTAEELGKAFAPVPVVTSGGKKVIDTIDPEPQLVIATPGAEPRVRATSDGDPAHAAYGAAVLLDTWDLLQRQDLRATERAFARWMHVASMVRPHTHGGQVVITAPPELTVVQHLIRFDAPGHAARELAARAEVDLPPTVSLAAIDGPQVSLDWLTHHLVLPPGGELLGPVDLPPGVDQPGTWDTARFGQAQRLLVRAPLSARAALAHALSSAQRARAAAKDELPLRIQINPLHVG